MEIGKQALEMSGVLSHWVLQSLRVAESLDEITLDDRITSLVLLTEIWINRPGSIDKSLEGVGEQILNILRKGARDVKQTLSVVSVELMFRLLENFAAVRNPVAPTLYKTLTFILVEFYWEIEVRQMMLKHFMYLFKKAE